MNCFRSYLEVETLRFKDDNGEEMQDETTFVYVENLKKLIDEVLVGRGITNPHLNIAVDGGGNKLIMVLQIFDMDELGRTRRNTKLLDASEQLSLDALIMWERTEIILNTCSRN